MSSIESALIVPMIMIVLCLTLGLFSETVYESLVFIECDNKAIAAKYEANVMNVSVQNLIFMKQYGVKKTGNISTGLHSALSMRTKSFDIDVKAVRYHYRIILTGIELTGDWIDEIKSW